LKVSDAQPCTPSTDPSSEIDDECGDQRSLLPKRPDLARQRRAAKPSEAQALEIGTSSGFAHEILDKQEGAAEKAGRHRQA